VFSGSASGNNSQAPSSKMSEKKRRKFLMGFRV